MKHPAPAGGPGGDGSCLGPPADAAAPVDVAGCPAGTPEACIPELHVQGPSRQWHSIRGILQPWLLLEQCKHCPHVDQGLLGLAVHGAQEVERHGQLQPQVSRQQSTHALQIRMRLVGSGEQASTCAQEACNVCVQLGGTWAPITQPCSTRASTAPADAPQSLLHSLLLYSRCSGWVLGAHCCCAVPGTAGR